MTDFVTRDVGHGTGPIKGGKTMTVGRYDDNTWAVYDEDGKVLVYGFFESQDAHDWIAGA